MKTIEQLATEVHEEHCLRLDVRIEEPLIPRPFVPRPRPQTAIISEAVESKLTMADVLERTRRRWRR